MRLLAFTICLPLLACWHPAPIDLPPTRVHTEAEIVGDVAEVRAAEDEPVEDEPVLNPEPTGLDPYWVITVVSPVTLVDDNGKAVGVLNRPGAVLEVRKEDGDVRRFVNCTVCTPATEGWVRMADIQLTKPPGSP